MRISDSYSQLWYSCVLFECVCCILLCIYCVYYVCDRCIQSICVFHYTAVIGALMMQCLLRNKACLFVIVREANCISQQM